MNRDQLDALIAPAIEYLTAEYDEDFPLVANLIKLRAILAVVPPEQTHAEIRAKVDAWLEAQKEDWEPDDADAKEAWAAYSCGAIDYAFGVAVVPPEPENCGHCLACEADRIPGATGITAELSRRMVVCIDCGNKRCPKASDHRLVCTNSNEPGQAGSIYAVVPDAPAHPNDELIRRGDVLKKMHEVLWRWPDDEFDKFVGRVLEAIPADPEPPTPESEK